MLIVPILLSLFSSLPFPSRFRIGSALLSSSPPWSCPSFFLLNPGATPYLSVSWTIASSFLQGDKSCGHSDFSCADERGLSLTAYRAELGIRVGLAVLCVTAAGEGEEKPGYAR